MATEPSVSCPGGVTPSHHPSVSVLVPTYLGASRLGRCLESLAGQTLACERFEVVVVHNGPPDGTREVVDEFVRAQPRLDLRLLELREGGAGHARNVGLAAVRGDYVTFVDDDDRVTSEYLTALLAAAAPGVVVAAMIGDVDEQAGPDAVPSLDHYVARGLGPRAGRTLPGQKLITAFSYNAAKLVSTHLARQARYDTSLRSGEDHVYWLELFARCQFDIRVLDLEDGALYLRTVRRGGVGSQDWSYEFAVRQRLLCMSAIESVDWSRPAVARVARGLLKGQASWLRAHLIEHPDERPRLVEDVRAARLREFPWREINRGLARDLALCYCFPPDLDTSGLVAAKRLRERGVVTDVISQDLSALRPVDPGSLRLAEEVLGNTRVLHGRAGFVQWAAMTAFAEAAWATIEEWEAAQGPYRSVYSRAMAPNSHFAAALLKFRRADIEWVAEFSDPLKLNALGQERVSPVTDDWLSRELAARLSAAGYARTEQPQVFDWAEKVAYAFADRIVFTNESQRGFMLANCDDPDLVDRVRQISEVRHHPRLPAHFYDLEPAEFRPEGDRVHLAYFGVFYSTRDLGDIVEGLRRLSGAERDRIRLHVFTTDPDTLTLQVVRAGLAGVVAARPYVPVLQFLSLTRQFDVLLVNDASTGDHHSVNPYLPSKVADYLGSGTPVWAIYEEGSVLSTMRFAYRSRVGELEDTLAVLRELISEAPRERTRAAERGHRDVRGPAAS